MAQQHALRSEREIAQLRQTGLLVWQAHQIAHEHIKPGVTTAEINAAVEQCIADNHAIALFKGVPSNTGNVPFPAAACISVNEQLVHGIPGNRRLREGDIVSIDIGCKFHNWCGDAAVTYAVGRVSPRVQKLLDVTEGALRLALELIPQKKVWSEVAREIETYVKSAGFSVIEGLVGHGIGHSLWETPQVPNYYTLQYEALGDFQLTPGTVIAIEPMVSMGSKRVKTLSDHWTISTQDGQPSAHFEHTIAITKAGVQVLTAGPDGKGWAL